MRLTGWQRLGIVFSALWVVGIGFKVFADWQRVSDGGAPWGGFAVLQDSVTGERYGNLSRKEVVELVILERQSAEALANAEAKIAWEKSLSPTDQVAYKEHNLSKMSDIGLEKLVKLPDPPKFDPTKPNEIVPDHSRNRVADNLIVSLKTGALMQSLFFPLLCFWSAFFTIRWVFDGFRKPSRQNTV